MVQNEFTLNLRYYQSSFKDKRRVCLHFVFKYASKYSNNESKKLFMQPNVLTK